MRKTTRWFGGLSIVSFILALATGCGSGPKDSASHPAGHVEVATTHFAVSADGMDSASVRSLAVALETNRQRIIDDLQATSMGTTHVIIQSQAAFEKQWASLIRGSGIGFQVQGLTGPDGNIYVYGPWAVQHPGRPLETVALHEFAHAATRRSAIDYVAAQKGDTAAYIAAMSDLGARVRWLSETIAVYEAGQSADLNRFWYLLRGNYPSIADLNDPTKSQVYDVGYRLAEFILAQWGPLALVQLIHHDGDIHAALGISGDELMRRWFLHAEDRYLLIKPRWFTTRR